MHTSLNLTKFKWKKILSEIQLEKSDLKGYWQHYWGIKQ